MSDWTFAVGDWRGTAPRHLLDTATARKIVWRLDAAGEASCTIDGRSPDGAGFAVLASDLWVYRNRVLLHRGRIVTAPETVGVDTHTVALTAPDYRGMLSRRYLQWAPQFVGVAQAEIAWALVNDTQTQTGGDLGIRRGLIPPGTPRDRTDYKIGDNIGERIADLGRVEGGFDWWIGPDRLLNIVTPTRGEATSAVLDYGGTVASLNREPDVAGYANSVMVTGGEGTAPVVRVASPTTDPRGRWEGVFSYPSVAIQWSLESKADQLLAAGIKPPIAYAVTLAPGAWPGAVPVEVGDTAWLVLESGYRSEKVQVRVEELSVAIGDSGDETVTLAVVATGVPLSAKGEP